MYTHGFSLVFGSSVELEEGSDDTGQVAQSEQDEGHDWKHLKHGRERVERKRGGRP